MLFVLGKSAVCIHTSALCMGYFIHLFINQPNCLQQENIFRKVVVPALKASNYFFLGKIRHQQFCVGKIKGEKLIISERKKDLKHQHKKAHREI